MTLPLASLFAKRCPVYFGIVNITPDSFSDGNPRATTECFLKKAEELIRDGADVIDVGAESTRPFALAIDAEEEWQRLKPFLTEFRKNFPTFPLSLDTRHYSVAQRAGDWGIQVLNDISFLSDPRFAGLSRSLGCHYILMHSTGTPQVMQRRIFSGAHFFQHVVQEIIRRSKIFLHFGGQREALILDPGFGFGKNSGQNLEMLEKMNSFVELGLPVLFGVSRKRFLTRFFPGSEPEERDEISAHIWRRVYRRGVKLVRCHNIKAHREILGIVKNQSDWI